MSGLYLFARIAGTPVAILTDEVEAVVRLEDLSPVPGVPAHVAGLSALRSRVLTVIDAAVLVRGQKAPDSAAPREDYAIMCDISGHSYGILVDGVDDIQTLEAMPLPIGGKIDTAWLPFAKGIINHAGTSHFVLSLGDFLDGFVSAQAA